MPRKTESGRIIISASEVGEFILCPESWRLRRLIKAPQNSELQASTRKEGIERHSDWALEMLKVSNLVGAFRVGFTLMMVLIVVFLLARL